MLRVPISTSSSVARPGSSGSLLEGVQYLRAIACAIVVLFHSRHYFSESTWVSVEAGGLTTLSFFVVSAFVLMHATKHITRPGDMRAALDFAVRRIIRIVPLYWLAVVIAAAGLWGSWLGSSDSLKELYWNWNPTLTAVIKDLFFIPHPHALGSSDRFWPLVIPAWTLNYEMLFYGLFTLALLSGRWKVPLAWVLLGIAAAAGLWAGPSAYFAKAYKWKVLLEFGLGIALYELWRRFGEHRRHTVSGFAFVSAGVLATSLGTWTDSRFGVASGAALLVWGCALLPRSRHWSLGLMRKIGDASYSIYLFHTIVAFKIAFWFLDYFGNVGSRVEAGELGRDAVLVTMGFILLLSVVIGLAIHQWIERPMVGWLLARLPSPDDRIVNRSDRHRLPIAERQPTANHAIGNPHS